MRAPLRGNLQLIRAMFGLPGYKLLFFEVWLLVITLFLWLPQVNLLAYIFTQAPLGLTEKFSFFFGYYQRVLFTITNPTVLSMVIFTLLTALSVLLLVFLVRTSKRMNIKSKSNKKAQVGVAATAVGSHILSCGGTLLLAPLFPALSGTSAILGGSGATTNQWLGISANLTGIVLVLYTIHKTGKDLTKMLLQTN